MSEIERIFREHHGRAIAVLVRTFGDIDLAEDAVSDAFAAALQLWPTAGLPARPEGWIITTAKNRAIDRLRREANRSERDAQALMSTWNDEIPEESALQDDQLRLIFTCCHPSLAVPSRVALTLRLVGGLTTPEIARAFLVSEATLAQRLVRAKTKIREAKHPYRIPDAGDLAARLGAVLAVVYLIFNEGYAASSGDDLVRAELCAEAIRLGRLLVGLLPDETEGLGLLALMLLLEARRPARTDETGRLVPLSEQDRTLWDHELISAGQAIVRRCLALNRPGPYQIQAAINAVHSDARHVGATDWKQILALYDQLLAIAPTPVIALNRAVALAEVEGPEAALRAIEKLSLDGYYLFHAIRADLFERLEERAAAKEAYERAIALTENRAERAFLRSKLERVASSQVR